ncbi:MAG: hypothetical protein JWM54_837 [Acidobacteriaceae bacterium]|nr:hypothetical protein [Acidobacteriaceae bacterium]
MTETRLPEPWLRGTLTEVPAVLRAVSHALQLAQEDAARWCGGLTAEQMNARPAGLPSIGFQLRHVAGTLDRLLTYAEGRQLNEEQLAYLSREGESREGDAVSDAGVLLREFAAAVELAMSRLGSFRGADLEAARYVGRKRLPTTVGGLLVHVADHTQRHVGQLITTAKLVASTSPETR